MINKKFYEYNNILDELHCQIKQCQNITNKNFCVVGLGGKDSWLTTLAANDVFGYHQVLAVNIYSIFSNSILPFKLSSICQESNIQYCDVDITKAIQETLSVQIGLFRVENERLHYMMNDLQKAEIIAMTRNTILKGIADRHDAMLLFGINLSKRMNGWVSPNISMFDWNPLVNCTSNQVKYAIENYNIGLDILDIEDGLDLNTQGGPFPKQYGIEMNNDDKLQIKEKMKNNKRIGVGIYQEC